MTSQDQPALITAETIFQVLSTLDRLADATPDRAGRIGHADLYRHVRNPDAAVTRELRDALEWDVEIRADFAQMIGKTARVRFPMAAAAASAGGVTTRDCAGFRITLRKSRAEPSQVYIIIDLADGDDAPPSHLFVLGQEVRYCKQLLPSPVNGAIQVLADAGSHIIRALEDCQSEVFLR